MSRHTPPTARTDVERRRGRILAVTTAGYVGCFAVWTIFAIIGVEIQREYHLSDTAFGLLVGMPFLSGSLMRPVLGVLADRHGGRRPFFGVMLVAVAATWLVADAGTMPWLLVAGLGSGIAGACSAVGLSYIARWYPRERHGTALGIFGAGNTGAALTKLAAPWVMEAWGWQSVARLWALLLLASAAIFWLGSSEDPEQASRRAAGQGATALAAQIAPLRRLQVWRFGLYYFFAFGGYVALAVWLPHYLVAVYGLDIRLAGALAVAFSLPAGLLRILGGVLSDRHGARRVMYGCFAGSLVCCFVLSYPPTDYIVHGLSGDHRFVLAIGLPVFVPILIALGFFLALGKAAVFKHIPAYYPEHVGVVGGAVGAIGGLGGFVLPVLFGLTNDLADVWTSCFMLLFGLAAISLAWMHLAVRRQERAAASQLDELRLLPDLEPDATDAGARARLRSTRIAPSTRRQNPAR
ncbi:MAG TPA: nitrate/nitrite transporter [Candidatus Sulfotelmatobacter sp.]|nr:nitrate/nitrite transporter [Candidatus Sulfotelmatobacter sp.]